MELKHSGAGIASFIISILMMAYIFMLVISAPIVITVAKEIGEQPPVAVIISLFILFLLIDLLALGLGIAGLFQKERKKIFSILGTIFASVAITGTTAVMIIVNLVRH